MGIFRKTLGALFGIFKDDPHAGAGAASDEEAELAGDEEVAPPRQRRGFSVQVPVNVERPSLGPIVVPCNLGEGGVQGFRWYGRRLQIDEDGDVADEFFDEVTLAQPQQQPPRSYFEVKHSTRPAPVRKQSVVLDGNLCQSIEYQGRVSWV